MSGRSAYVRKVKVDKNNKAGYDFLNKDDTLKGKEHTPSVKSDPSISEFPRANNGVASNFADHPDFMKSDENSAKSIYNSYHEADYNPGYARIRRPEMPIIETSGIEKSAFRSKMEKSSENFRNNFANVFKKKKGVKEELNETPPTTPIREEEHEFAAEEMQFPVPKPLNPVGQIPRHANEPAYKRVGAPRGEVPQLPAKLKLWRRKGQQPVLWDKVDVRDPDLWDLKGDVLVFYAGEAGVSEMPQPCFRLNSHLVEAVGSPLLDALLREGITDDMDNRNVGGSYRDDSSRPKNLTPPASESSKSFDVSQISYRFTLPAAGNISGQQLLRYKLSWRNVFASTFVKGLVGYTLHQALIDLQERMLAIMPRHQNLTYIPVDYSKKMGWHDIRDDPELACSMLIWSEHKKIHWQQGWLEAFVHCAGMYNQVALLSSWKSVSPTTKLMLEKASVETSTRVAYCEGLLANFDYGSYWPESSNRHSVSSREAFVGLQGFFRDHYSDMFGTWPPAPPVSKHVDGWLTRLIVRTLAADFYALYDYLVDRQVVWNGSAEIHSRRTNIVRLGSPEFRPDSHDCDFTNLIERFDSHHNFPSIPHPYPRLPQSCPPSQGRMTQLEARKAALAYTEATNVFFLPDDYEGNDLVEAYVQWEKIDRIGECDPRSARRARWVLIYFVVQTLSSLVVDTPGLLHTEQVEYFLSGKVGQQPSWIEDQSLKQEAEHNRSHCWTVSSTWQKHAQVENSGHHAVPERLEPTATGRSMSSVSSFESGARTTTFSEAETANDLDAVQTSSAASIADSEASFLTMQPPDQLSIRTRDLSPKPAPSPSPKPVSIFPPPQRLPIEQSIGYLSSSRPSERYYSTASPPPSLPPNAPLPQPPSSHGSTPRHFPNPNRNMTAYQSPHLRPAPYQSSYAPPPPGHEGEIMGLRIQKSASTTPIFSPTLSSPHPNTLSQRSISGYAPGIEKLEEPTWPGMRNHDYRSGNSSPLIGNHKGHQKGRNVPLSGQQVVQIRDFDEQA